MKNDNDTPNNLNDIMQMELLQEAFSSFNTATAELQQSYDKLKQQVNDLNIELAEKNITLEKNLKEKEELQEYLQNILENAPNGVTVIDNDGKVKSFNLAAEDITGVRQEEIIDRSINNIFPEIDKSFIDTLNDKPDAVLPIDEGKRLLERCEVACKNGDLKIINIYISKLSDRKKRRIGSVIAFEDVTNLRRLEEQVERKNRLEAMGEMAAGISHEIRNPLGAIELFASLLKRDVKGDEPKEELADNIIAGVKSLTNITSNLLLFTKDVRPKFEPVDLSEIISDALIFTEYASSQKNIELIKDIDNDSCGIDADPELIKQVLLNLVLNAVQAMKKPGTISVSVRRLSEKEKISATHNSEYIQIIVEDSGPGISKEDIQKVFNPFFTTKHSGLGLGLAIVHKIITSHNGIIEVSSKKNQGTSFSILLPKQRVVE